MKESKYNSMEGVFAPIMTAIGIGVAAWGGDMMREAYEDEARKDENIREYRHCIDKVESRMDHLTRQYEAGKITKKQYQKRFERYETELDDLYDELSEVDVEIEEKKKEGLRLIMKGGGLSLEGHLLDMVAKLFED